MFLPLEVFRSKALNGRSESLNVRSKPLNAHSETANGKYQQGKEFVSGKSELFEPLAHLFVILRLRLEDRRHPGKTQIKFGFSLGLHNFETASRNYFHSEKSKYIWLFARLFVILHPK